MAKTEVETLTHVHETRVKIDLIGLSKTIQGLKADYDKIGNRDTKAGRSKFSKYNNINKFYERILTGEHPSEIPVSEGSAIITLTGTAKGNSSRVYYKPSVTSLSKPVRKHIVPINEGSKFVFFDLKAAEFFMNCVFSGEQKAVTAYLNGDDIYQNYAHLFPPNTPREAYKQALIGNMYGLTGYRLARELSARGFSYSQTQAERLLQIIAQKLPNMTKQKTWVIGNAMRSRKYICPDGFDLKHMKTVATVPDGEDVNALVALSVYVQSALGYFIQHLIQDLEPRQKGTLLTVFDSVLCEVSEANLARYKAWAIKRIAPFRADAFNVGSSFFNAQEGLEGTI